MYNCVVFDVDGTLIDTEKAVVTSFQAALLDETGNNYDYEEVIFGYGIPLHNLVKKFNVKNAESFEEIYLGHLKEKLKNVGYFPGVVDLLKSLNDINILTGIVTSRSRYEVERDPILQGLMKYLKYNIAADDTAKHKPDGDPLLKFYSLSNAEAANSIYIGDTYYDYMCAKNSGTDFALASWGARNTEGIEAKYIFEEPKDILKFCV